MTSLDLGLDSFATGFFFIHKKLPPGASILLSGCSELDVVLPVSLRAFQFGSHRYLDLFRRSSLFVENEVEQHELRAQNRGPNTQSERERDNCFTS